LALQLTSTTRQAHQAVMEQTRPLKSQLMQLSTAGVDLQRRCGCMQVRVHCHCAVSPSHQRRHHAAEPRLMIYSELASVQRAE
jgi:hypothetical protein